MKITQENYIQELIKTYTAAAELAAFSKKYPVKTFCLGRHNGKTRLAYLFLRYYISIIEACDKAERKIARPSFFRRFKIFITRLLMRFRFRKKKVKKLTKDGYTPRITVIDEMHEIDTDHNYEATMQATPRKIAGSKNEN